MTNKIALADGMVGELKNCPFCNCTPYAPTRFKKKKHYTGCTNGNCEIFGIHINIKNWNKRS